MQGLEEAERPSNFTLKTMENPSKFYIDFLVFKLTLMKKFKKR